MPATHLPTCAARFCLAVLTLGGVLMHAPATAQQRPVTSSEADVRDVALTPLTDLNLSRDPIPAVLIVARTAPYSREGIATCSDILRHVGDLDAVLGDDFDTRPPAERGISATNLVQRVIGSFIPFRGIIREISGANAHEFQFREAIAAGLMRRAYLKGVGQEMGCPYPASPAPPDLVERLQNGEDSQTVTPQEEGASEYYYSQPVIQDIE